MKKLNRAIFGLSLGLILTTANFAWANENPAKRERRAQEKVEIKVQAWGPAQAEIDAAKLRVTRSPAVQKVLAGTKYRIFAFEYIENDVDKSKPSTAPTRFRVIFYDYTNDRTIVAEGDFAAKEAIVIREESAQPNANDEEFEEAVRIVRSDARFAQLLRGEKLRVSQPMPPITVLDGTTERLVNVALEPLDGSTRNEIVSVSINRGTVIRYDAGAPEMSRATPDSCGPSSSNQGSTSNGTAGQYQLTVRQGKSVLWEMLVIRPSASSGNSFERSGIEVRDVRYKGKSVLKRGHAPVLNVNYTPATGQQNCGPFRDWQYQEGFFNAPEAGATDPAPGIRVLAAGQNATTQVDTGNDTGNFRGVAIYTQNVGFGDEIVMVSEMNAGWYRYIMEWRFAPDGTIRPRYGYGATLNSCVCTYHHHHTYWRFDFDIVNPTNKVFQVERGRKFLQPVTNEIARLRSTQTNRGYLIQNSTGNEAYLLAPNVTDGEYLSRNTSGAVISTYGAGDFWLLKYQGTAGAPGELDDPNSSSAANLAPWVNNESLVNQDVVVWYAAHFMHTDGANLLDPNRINPSLVTSSHVVGPDIRPVRW